MAAYYHSHHHHENNTASTTTHEIPDHNGNLHTLILMNSNLAHHHHHHHPSNTPTHGYDQTPHHPPSQNILLLNSAATAASFSHSSPPLPHHFVRLPAPEHNNITLYGYPQEEAREVTRARQGLSLSLSSQNPISAQHEGGGGDGDVACTGQLSVVLGSKYLRPAQELLEEVVHVGDHALLFKTSTNNTTDDQSPKKGKGVGDTVSEEIEKQATQLSTAEKQEIQMKKAKLVTMLGEAEQRYRQYHTQMQIVVESFERAAGIGSAKTYTALALKTISKQFRCLKDAIQGQIRAASKSLGEEGGGGSSSSAGKIEGSRLKFIDHQIRQQRALQQLGMIQNHNAWRPQRGLPERSVSVLRAWLFEHFLHPYPKDSDKIMLAKQTGLTRSQVSNWFINARVRLWKPMIEDMYNEELKDHEQQMVSEDKASSKEYSNEDAGGSISVSEHDFKSNNNNFADQAEVKTSKDQHNHNHNNNVVNSSNSFMSIPTSSPPTYKATNHNLHQNQHGFTLTGSLDMEGLSQGNSPKRPRNNNNNNAEVLDNGEILIKFGSDEKQGRDDENNGYNPIISGGMNFMGGGELGSYPMGDMARFGAEDFATQRFLQGNNGISLSLGLPPSCETTHHQQFNPLPSSNHTFMSSPNQNIQFRRGNEYGSMSSPPSHSSAAAFECIDIQNRKGFAAQLLPDFVA